MELVNMILKKNHSIHHTQVKECRYTECRKLFFDTEDNKLTVYCSNECNDLHKSFNNKIIKQKFSELPPH